jgi:L-histidine Nalpha-methyltransferase
MHSTYDMMQTVVAPRTEEATFAADLLAGLSGTPKTIPSRYFYDARGSRLFQQITELEEYYPTRCEYEILENCKGELAAAMSRAPFRLVELGAGDGRKTDVLLRELLAAGRMFEFVPIDICPQTIAALTAAVRRLPGGAGLPVRGIAAEYFQALTLLDQRRPQATLALLLGSNIGNFAPRAARRLLHRVRRSLRRGDLLVIGFDLQKDLDLMLRAYQDARGVTSEFNFNLLERINRELGGQFNRDRFRHHASYNLRAGRMESWLVSREAQRVPIRALKRDFAFRAWEGMHTESSYKYDIAQIEALAVANGFQVARHFFDHRRWFVDSLWRAD